MSKRRRLTCAQCGKLLTQPRPVYLLDDATQAIRGPLHVGCAVAVKVRGEVAYEQFKAHAPQVGYYLVGQPELLGVVDGATEEASE
jgi:hypothetical protein